MIEIFLLFFLIRKVRRLAEQKGENETQWTFKLLSLWFLVEFSVIYIGVNYFSDKGIVLISMFAITIAFLLSQFIVKLLEQKEDKENIDTSNSNLEHFR